VFTQICADLQRLYGVAAEEIICDAHPDYTTTRWAMKCGLPVTKVLHHHAHAAALAGEHDARGPLLVFTWDGVGLGADQTLWGGETFLGEPGNWRRVASLRPFRLPGGERAGRAPWRSAAALCWELGRELPRTSVDPLVRLAWNNRLNCPETSSVGRLFDAAASVVLGVDETSFEGQGPMMLEAAAAGVHASCEALPTYRDGAGLMRIDWEPLLTALIEAAANDRTSASQSASVFHATLAATITSIARGQRALSGVNVVGLTGGVFQNARLTELAHGLLTREGFQVRLAERLPCGDGGLSYGQIIEAGSARKVTP
jgi:hydrogenase maturation protein HypF